MFSLGGPPWPARVRRLAALIRARRYDVVEAYGFKASFVARFAARSSRPRPGFVCGVQGLHVTEVLRDDEPKGRVALALERRTTSLVDHYDVNSHGALELLATAGIARERMTYIPNGVDTCVWTPADPQARDAPPLVICAARLVDRKRQVDLVDALRLLRGRGSSRA